MEGREFLGRGVKFPLQIDPRTGKLAMSGEEENIRECIGIILRTSRGERVMRPDFGTDVMEYLFQPVTSGQEALEEDLRQQLVFLEPRITDVEVACTVPDALESTLEISVAYTVRSTNNRYNHVYPFYVTEGSEGGGGA